MLAPRRRDRSNVTLIIHSILASRGSSLAEIARQSRVRFSRSPLFHIPPNFYDALRRPSFSPSLHQVYALSVLTGYRIADWLSLFGISFDDVARFQAAWSQRRTAELDAHIYDRKANVSWFEETQPISLGSELTSLGNWLSGMAIRPLDSLSSRLSPSFRYLKIGSTDAYSFPDLLPGSIVRVDGRLPSDVIRPILQNAKLPWYGWHAFRRGLATNLHRLGVSDRVIQEVLRHANVTTTMNIYVKMVSADAVIAMKALEAICATTVQPEVLKKLVSDLELSHGKSQCQKQLGELAERGGFEPPVGVLAPTTV